PGPFEPIWKTWTRRLSGLKDGTTTAIYRTRIAVTNGLWKKLKELMMEFQGLRQRMMTEYKETVERRYFTVTGEYPDEEVIEKIISNGEEEEFLGKAIGEHGMGKVMETVVEIQDRHDAAKEIEKSLLELHQVEPSDKPFGETRRNPPPHLQGSPVPIAAATPSTQGIASICSPFTEVPSLAPILVVRSAAASSSIGFVPRPDDHRHPKVACRHTCKLVPESGNLIAELKFG
ncbi:hypothetical protein S83_055962, partial [Arachis hypogaea]